MQYFYMRLDLCGEGGGDGAGEAGAVGTEASAVNPADAEQARLRELGVPDSVLERRAKRAKNRPTAEPAAYAAQSEAQTAEQPDAEAETSTEPQQAKRMTWEEIMADPEYNKAMQQTVQQRLKSSKASEERLGKLAPVLEALGTKYGIDTDDVDALVKAVSSDDSYYESKADELGVSVEQARQLDQLEKYRQREERAKQQTFQEQQNQQHFLKLVQQGDELRKTFPNFNLQQELQNPTFLRMTAPGSGISVQDAYYAVHRAEIESARAQAVADGVQRKLANAVQANAARPSESSGVQATSLTTVDYSRLSKQQRADLRQAIHAAAARGEKLTPEAYFGRRK